MTKSICLQEEAKKLKSEEALHKDLKDRFEGVSKELEATKDTLAATLSQLADRTTTASASERTVADASQNLAVRTPILLHPFSPLPVTIAPLHTYDSTYSATGSLPAAHQCSPPLLLLVPRIPGEPTTTLDAQ
jgi:hypothetical protein